MFCLDWSLYHSYKNPPGVSNSGKSVLLVEIEEKKWKKSCAGPCCPGPWHSTGIFGYDTVRIDLLQLVLAITVSGTRI